MAKFFIKAELPDAYEVAKKLGVDKDGDVQNFVTDEIMRNLPDFMPRDSGKLINSMRKRHKSAIRIETPYARFLFFGKTASGAPVDYSAQNNPQGGPNWDRRMVAARGSVIASRVKQFAKLRNRKKK